jgi:hypothetical protein
MISRLSARLGRARDALWTLGKLPHNVVVLAGMAAVLLGSAGWKIRLRRPRAVRR